MFISKEQIAARSGYDIDQETLSLAHLMIETWVGRTEPEIEDGSDLAILANATMFQAIYISENGDVALVEAAVKSKTVGESTSVLDTEKFSPYLSVWAWKACQRLSWMGTRTIHTGPVFDRAPRLQRWETT